MEARDTSSMPGSVLSAEAVDERSQTIPIFEEVARVDTREVVTGRVKLRTITDMTEHAISRELSSETVEITRVPMDREVMEAPALRQEGDVTIISVVEEIIVVTKRLIVKEEVHIRRITSTERLETSIDLKKQHVVVERSGVDNASTVILTTGDDE